MICRLNLYQFPDFDIVLQLCKMLPLWESDGGYGGPTCSLTENSNKSTVISKQNKKKFQKTKNLLKKKYPGPDGLTGEFEQIYLREKNTNLTEVFLKIKNSTLSTQYVRVAKPDKCVQKRDIIGQYSL